MTAEDFSDKLRGKLRALHPDHLAPKEKHKHMWAHVADQFVESVLSEARYMLNEFRVDRSELNRRDLLRERDSLLLALERVEVAIVQRRRMGSTISKAQAALRAISPTLSRALPIEADNLTLADLLATPDAPDSKADLASYIAALQALSPPSERNMRLNESRRRVAIETALRVTRVLPRYEFSTAVSIDRLGKPTIAIRVMKLIGDDIGLVLNWPTWRDLMTPENLEKE